MKTPDGFRPSAKGSGNALPRLLAMVAITLSLFAQPAAAIPPRDVVLVLDNSGSMKTNDPGFVTRQAASNFIHLLDEGVNLAIVLFDENVRVLQELGVVNDASRPAMLESLTALDFRGQRTNSPQAIVIALSELKTRGRAGADQSIVFMTDGKVDTGDPQQDAEARARLLDSVAGEARERGIHVYAVAFTDNADLMLLQALATGTAGEYYLAETADALTAKFEQVDLDIRDRLTNLDSDGDGLTDLDEAALGTDKDLADTDGDGIDDGREAGGDSRSSPLLADTDADGLDDGRELEQGTAPDKADSDDDGLDDKRESTLTCCDPLVADSDGDGLKDGREVDELGTDAGRADTDGDGVSDGQEVANGTDPRVDESPAVAPVIEQGPPVLLFAAAGLGALLLVIIVVLLGRKGGSGPKVATGFVPDAFLDDLAGVTGDPSHKISCKPVIIGRERGSDPDLEYIVVKDTKKVSRSHARIEYRDNEFWIADLDSANGTFVNDERISGQARKLKPGDDVRVHTFQFKFLIPGEAADSDATQLASEATLLADIEATQVASGEANMPVDPLAGAEESLDFEPDDDEEDSEAPTEIKGIDEPSAPDPDELDAQVAREAAQAPTEMLLDVTGSEGWTGGQASSPGDDSPAAGESPVPGFQEEESISIDDFLSGDELGATGAFRSEELAPPETPVESADEHEDEDDEDPERTMLPEEFERMKREDPDSD